MNGWFLAAAALCMVGFIGHIVHGERRYVPAMLGARLMVEKDEAFTGATLRGAWHVWAFAYTQAAAVLGAFSFVPVDAGATVTLWALVAMFTATTIMLLVLSRGQLVAVYLQTAVVVLMLVGLLVA